MWPRKAPSYPIWPSWAKCWPMLAKCGQQMAEVGRVWLSRVKLWPTLAKVGQHMKMSAKFGRSSPKFGRVDQHRPKFGKTSAKLDQNRPECVPIRPELDQFGPSLGYRGHCSTTVEKLLRNLWATCELAGIAGVICSGSVAAARYLSGNVILSAVTGPSRAAGIIRMCLFEPVAPLCLSPETGGL